MDKKLIILALIIFPYVGYAQLLPGNLEVVGILNINQSISETISEAGEDDADFGFESAVDEVLLSFILEPGFVLGIPVTSSQNCSENIFRYAVYLHTENSPSCITLEAKSVFNGGNRFPANILYDELIIKPLGPRDLIPENGGSYIPIPNQGTAAIKVLEFVGCRENIPLQFKVRASTTCEIDAPNFQIIYTIVGSLL